MAGRPARSCAATACLGLCQQPPSFEVHAAEYIYIWLRVAALQTAAELALCGSASRKPRALLLT